VYCPGDVAALLACGQAFYSNLKVWLDANPGAQDALLARYELFGRNISEFREYLLRVDHAKQVQHPEETA